jgi:DNA-binding XRE family transcriptional regulator
MINLRNIIDSKKAVLNGNKIKELRKEKNLSQFKLSIETDISRELIDKIENGHRARTSLETAVKLAVFFNVKIEDLL